MSTDLTSLTYPEPPDTAVRAVAHPNIALIKYWGKRQTSLNLPAVDSVSITLDTLTTTTTLMLTDSDRDALWLNGEAAQESQLTKLRQLADAFRQLSGQKARVHVASDNNFPTAAGLASSASGYAALVLALNEAYQTRLSPSALSVHARIGSGSAARSLFGGFAHMHKGQRDDGTDAYAEPVLAASAWPLEVVVAIASEGRKAVSSTVGMESTRTTSPFYSSWVESQQADVEAALAAIRARDFDALATLSEYSCFKMHGLMLSARPGLTYWNAATVSAIEAVRALRRDGLSVFVTIDAGPQVKAVCAPGSGDDVAAALAAVPGIHRVIRTGLGGGARCLPAQGL